MRPCDEDRRGDHGTDAGRSTSFGAQALTTASSFLRLSASSDSSAQISPRQPDRLVATGVQHGVLVTAPSSADRRNLAVGQGLTCVNAEVDGADECSQCSDRTGALAGHLLPGDHENTHRHTRAIRAGRTEPRQVDTQHGPRDPVPSTVESCRTDGERRRRPGAPVAAVTTFIVWVAACVSTPMTCW